MHCPAILRTLALLTAASVLALSGCASGTLLRTPGQLIRDPGRLIGRSRTERNIGRIVTLWEPSQGKDPDGRNSRGFAGQILFFGPNGKTGCRVCGKVVISVYDEYDPDADGDPVLLHKFEFGEEAWEAHRGEGTLGHSYSVFVPYTRSHKDQVNCALKVELVQQNGRTISSQETEVLLPGKNTVQAAASRTRGFVRERQLDPGRKVTPAAASQTDDELDTLSIPLPKKKK